MLLHDGQKLLLNMVPIPYQNKMMTKFKFDPMQPREDIQGQSCLDLHFADDPEKLEELLATPDDGLWFDTLINELMAYENENYAEESTSQRDMLRSQGQMLTDSYNSTAFKKALEDPNLQPQA